MKDVHTAHCCAKCGCKYGKDDECTVATGKAPAQYGCEFCEEELDYIKQNIPEGYALVPVEPTEEMIAAAHHEVDQAAIHNYGGPADPMDIWQAMIAAAQESEE